MILSELSKQASMYTDPPHPAWVGQKESLELLSLDW